MSDVARICREAELKWNIDHFVVSHTRVQPIAVDTDYSTLLESVCSRASNKPDWPCGLR